MIFVEYLLRARQLAKCFACMILFSPHHNLMRLALLMAGPCRNWDLESLNDLPKAAQLVDGEAGIWTETVRLEPTILLCYAADVSTFESKSPPPLVFAWGLFSLLLGFLFLLKRGNRWVHIGVC